MENQTALVLLSSLCVVFGALVARWAQAYAHRLVHGAMPDGLTLGRAALDIPLLPWQPLRDTLGALLAGLFGVWLLLSLGKAGPAWVLLCLVLLALAWIDARSGLLPDALTLPLMLAGWLWGPLGLVQASSASALVWVGLTGAAVLYQWLRHHDGFGAGDIKCLAALAGWLGIGPALGVLWGACVMGLLWWICTPRPRQRSYPFGPCIALASLLVLLADPALHLGL